MDDEHPKPGEQFPLFPEQAHAPAPMVTYDRLRIETDSMVSINEEEVEGSEADAVIEYWENDGNEIKQCRFCATPLIIVQFDGLYPERPWRAFSEYEDRGDQWRLSCCDHCAHWCLSHEGWGDPGPGMSWYTHEFSLAKAREFEPDLPEGIASEIAQALRRNPGLFHSINPLAFEKFVGDVYRANFAHSEVMHVGKSHDGGVDLVFVGADAEEWLIQVKRRTKSSSTEPVDTVRNLLGTLLVQNVPRGIVVSTADHFSYWAQAEASSVHPKGYTVELVDRGKLNRMLSPLLPARPWLKALEYEAPHLREYFVQEVRRIREYMRAMHVSMP
jgi:hypothetical protein